MNSQKGQSSGLQSFFRVGPPLTAPHKNSLAVGMRLRINFPSLEKQRHAHHKGHLYICISDQTVLQNTLQYFLFDTSSSLLDTVKYVLLCNSKIMDKIKLKLDSPRFYSYWLKVSYELCLCSTFFSSPHLSGKISTYLTFIPHGHMCWFCDKWHKYYSTSCLKISEDFQSSDYFSVVKDFWFFVK